MLNEAWLKYPTGRLPKGSFCDTCARFTNRNTTCTVIVLSKNKVLFIKRDHEPMKGAWALPGGYLTWDETVEQTAARELKEETGLTAGKLHLVGIRSDLSAGDERQNIDLYFYTCEVSGELMVQAGEVAEIQWFDPQHLPSQIAFNHEFLLQQFLERIAVAPDAPVPVVI